MPKSVSSQVEIVYPWGAKLTVRLESVDMKDLAAQSANFEWTLSESDGSMRRGTFTAIGGAPGSFESCYFPRVRKIEASLTKQLYLLADSDRFFQQVLDSTKDSP